MQTNLIAVDRTTTARIGLLKGFAMAANERLRGGEVSLERLLLVLTTVLCAIFVTKTAEVLKPPGTPFLPFDSFFYFREAWEIYASPSIGTITGLYRPFYAWWIPFLVSRGGGDLTVAELDFLTHAAAFAFLLGGLFLLNRGRSSSSLGIAWALVLILSVPIGTLFSHPFCLMADFYLSGYILFVEGVFSRFEKSGYRHRGWAAASALVLAGGLQTKPIFLFWAAPRLCLSAVRFFSPRQVLHRWQPAGLFLGVAIAAAAVLFPRRFVEAARDLKLNNEVLKNLHPGQINTSVDWFFATLKDFVLAGGLPSVLLVMLLVTILICSFRLPRVGWSLRSIVEALLIRPMLLTIVFCAAYLTWYVVGKDLRMTQFLFVLTVSWIAWAVASKIQERARPLVLLVTSIVVCLAGGRLVWSRTANATFEQFGYDRVVRAILADVRGTRMEAKSGQTFVFLSVNSEEYNDNALAAYQLAIRGLSRREWPDSIGAHSAVFRVGAFGYPGGFPKGFFADPYVVVLSEPVEKSQERQVGFYNFWIEERMLAKDSAFLDGLKEIARIDNDVGMTWVIFRREAPVSEGAFASILNAAIRMDPDNIWNEPWRIALKRIEDPRFDADSPEERARRKRLLAGNVYDLSKSDWGRWSEKILQNSEPEFRTARYPEIFADPGF